MYLCCLPVCVFFLFRSHTYIYILSLSCMVLRNQHHQHHHIQRQHSGMSVSLSFSRTSTTRIIQLWLYTACCPRWYCCCGIRKCMTMDDDNTTTTTTGGVVHEDTTAFWYNHIIHIYDMKTRLFFCRLQQQQQHEYIPMYYTAIYIYIFLIYSVVNLSAQFRRVAAQHIKFRLF